MESPETLQNSLTPEQAAVALWNEGILHWMLHDGQKSLYDGYQNCNDKTLVWNCSRRFGKCREENSTVLTPNGQIPIKDIKIGDKVYGYNKNGSVSLTTVTNVIDSGIKEVFDLTVGGRKIEACTDDHVWLTDRRVNGKNYIKERPLKKFHKGTAIVREFIDIPCGNVDNPHAYALGALLGDGCSKQLGNAVYISSEDDSVVKKVSNILGTKYYKNSKSNYTWMLSYEGFVGKGGDHKYVNCNLYDDWCKNRYAHEKITNLDIIKTWNRNTCLEYLAGLIDTDGSVNVSKNMLQISFTSQSKSLMDSFVYLFYKLFQYKPTIVIDDRDKYKNGSCFVSVVRNNIFTKRALRELSSHLAKEKKQWKSEYENLPENNTSKKSVGIKKGEGYKAQCYDITVDNETNLYLTGDGLVTHNSFTLCVIAIEACLKKPNALVKYCSAKQVDARGIIRPLIRDIITSCPKELRPDFKVQERAWVFPNGSRIELSGLDGGRAESIRGGSCDLAIIDEAGLVNDLQYIMTSIILPTTLTTKGKIILASTPPKSYVHPFINYVNTARIQGNLSTKTIYDNPLIDYNELQKIIEESGGQDSVTFKREFLCHVIKDDNYAIIPEFTKEIKELCVKEWPRAPFYDSYVAMDLGLKDLTVVLFAWYDFREGKIIIEDEFVINGQKFNTQALAEGIKKKEEINFTDKITGEQRVPFLRVSDNNLIVINDLWVLHGLRFLATRKDDADAALNNVKILIQNQKIIINPRCKTLILHLEAGVWNKNKTSFERSGTDTGHFDAIDSLKYLVRNVSLSKNPFPTGYLQKYNENHFSMNGGKPVHAQHNEFAKVFNLKKN